MAEKHAIDESTAVSLHDELSSASHLEEAEDDLKGGIHFFKGLFLASLLSLPIWAIILLTVL